MIHLIYKANMIRRAINIIALIATLVSIVLSIFFYKANKRANRYETNYETLSKGTKHYVTKEGKVISEVDGITITTNEMYNDTSLKDILSTLDSINIKFRNISNLIDANVNIEKYFNTKIYKDTIIVTTDTVIRYKEYDKYNNGILKLERFVLHSSDTAHYKYTYTPNLTIAINKYRDGKWTPRNILHWRDVKWKVNMTSNDKDFKANLKYIINNKYKN